MMLLVIRILIAAIGAVLSFALAACGSAQEDASSGSAKKSSGFIASADRLCQSASKHLADAQDIIEYATTPQEFDKGERDSIRLLTQLATDLRALKEPAKLSAPLSALISSLDASVAEIESEGYSILRYDDTFNDVRSKAEAVGLEQCIMV